MADLPTIEQVLEAIDRMPKDWTRPAGDDAGLGFVAEHKLARELIPPGSPLWKRPGDRPSGLDRSPAFDFMDRLGFDPSIETVRIRGLRYFARKP